MEHCPTCGVRVDVSAATERSEHRGIVYYFCCSHCKADFEQDPGRPIARASGQAQEMRR